ncbi:MAG: T9SS type A sorting domain-containing protein [Chryseobacterium sp.]|nr:T9SS type A sorting domain-containing protein [Chryseobacterium sp.]
MMKTKLFFWLVFLSIGMQAQNINFPDANFKALLLSSSPSNTIAKNLSGNYFSIDANGDGEISAIEAQTVSEIKIRPKMINFGGYEEPDFNELDSIMSYEGINNFTNATSIELYRIAMPTSEIIISGLSNLKSFSSGFYNSDPGKVSLMNCPSLEALNLSSIELTDGNIIPQLKKLNLTYGVSPTSLFLDKIQNAYLLENLILSSDSFRFDPSEVLILSNHNNLRTVNISNVGFDNIDLSHCDQLTSVSVTGNYSDNNPLQIGTLDVSDCPLLTDLNLNSINGNSGVSVLIANNCSSLETIKSNSQFLQTMSAKNCPLLSSVDLYACNILEASNVPSLKTISVQRFNGDSFDATPVTNLEALNLNYFNYSTSPYVNAFGSLKNLTVKNNAFLKDLGLNNQPVSDLDISGMQSLEMLSAVVGYRYGADPQPNFSTDFLHYLNAENCHSLKEVDVSGQSGLIDANFTNNTSLKQFVFQTAPFSGGGIIEKLNFENCSLLENIEAGNCKLKELNIKNCASLKNISVDSNNLESLSFDNTPNIENLYLSKNKLTSLDINNLEKLKLIYFDNNNLKTLDASNNKNLEVIALMNNPVLESLFIKNGKQQYIEEYSGAYVNTNIKYICADDSEIEEIKSNLVLAGITANVNSYCSFTPGGSYNTISGAVKIDSNNNGCDANDNPFEFLKLKINDGTTSGETFVQQNGKYEFYTQAGNFNITALAENPALFTISPANFSTSFADSNNNIFTQDICVTANGNQNDAEVVIAPLTGARPGFEATYKLVWRNKGNTTLSGKIVLNYDQNKMTFQSSSMPYAAISNGSLEFNYSNLKPYANEATELIFTINTPTNPTNPVNSGDILSFNAQITPNASDLTPEDNNFKFDQTVVNSFDPNDITCMEGEIIPTTAVGKYMHYVVNFENTGTAEAENIVVKMKIDPAEFDINTLQLQNASSDVTTVITGNDVEFKFKKIKLKAGGHGNVLLKVRSVTDLQEGDSVDNSADIYFDYNFPITTNEYVTTILDEHSLLNAKINYEASEFASNNYKVNFDASLSTGNITSYAWEFPNAASVSSTSAIKPMVTYNVAGNYTAKLTISDVDNNLSVKTITFKVGNTTADLSTGRDNNGNAIAIDADDDDWKGYDINGTEITPKIRHTYPGWSYADIGNGNNSQWISLNNFEGYYNYKSRAFTIPNNATDAKLNLRSLSFVRNWTYLVKVEADGSETETEITKTQWQSDGFKGWLNSRSPKVDNYSLSPGTYYIKVLVYSNNSAVRESLDVNAIVTCSTGLMNANKLVPPTITLQTQDVIKQNVSVYPVPTHGELNIDSDSDVLSVEVHDVLGRILQKKHFAPSRKVKLTINNGEGVYFLKIMTKQGIVNQKIIKE